MTTTASATSPRETDEQLAGLYAELYTAQDKLALYANSVKQTAGADYYYRGRQRVTDLSLDEAIGRLEGELAKHADDRFGYARLDAPCSASSSVGGARSALEGFRTWSAKRQELLVKINKVEATYTGWSRFFLVTSSAGHVHSSMHCSTCRPTTRYGWLPQLSGQDEAEAVDALGPTLCTVCFPSAPLTWTEGKKLAASQAAKLAA